MFHSLFLFWIIIISILLLLRNLVVTALHHHPSLPFTLPPPPPIVYTIAGSDSGGGAGIQADLHAIHAMNCHGCSVITCLTAQNSVGVHGIHAPPVDFLRMQFNTLMEDMVPDAIKIGMIGTKDLAVEIGSLIPQVKSKNNLHGTPWIVLDPVMISTSGHKLILEETKEAILEHIFPHVDIVTPNKYEAEELLRRKIHTFLDVERAAQEIISKFHVKAVLIKGGHLIQDHHDGAEEEGTEHASPSYSYSYAQDYFLSSEGPLTPGEERLCDGCRGVWLRSKRYDSIHTHGTGCTLSSCIASALAIGHQERHRTFSVDDTSNTATGANRSIYMIDACCLGKAYVTAGVACSVQIGHGPGPVVHTSFPSQYEYFPEIVIRPDDKEPKPFRKIWSHNSSSSSTTSSSSSTQPSSEDDTIILGEVLPIVDDIEWLEKLAKLELIRDIQLRIKGITEKEKILELVSKCQGICQENGVRLWINDFWEAAIQAKCFGVHLGQEDLAKCVHAGGLEQIKANNLALGISTHSYAELSAAKGIKPSYISLGPIFGTQSKNVAFDPQRLSTVRRWRDLIEPDVPLVVIGGINDADRVKQVKDVGAECVAVIGAVKKEDYARAVQDLCEAMK